MRKNGPIIVIDDDTEECEFVRDALRTENIQNEVLFFSKGSDVLDFLEKGQSHPFLIISDINISDINGIELIKRIKEEKIGMKGVPFVFLTTTATPSVVNEAFRLGVDGFFEKKLSIKEIGMLIKNIYEYWQESELPDF